MRRALAEDPFALLGRHLAPLAAPVPGLPFAGGALGYFAYDLARRLERVPEIARSAEQVPDMAVGIYDWALIVDHRERRCWLVGQGRDPRTRRGWHDWVALFGRPPAARARRPFVPSPSRSRT